jgi:hypothetical protein
VTIPAPNVFSNSSDAATRKPAGWPVMSLLMPQGVALPATRRLLVLVPDLDLDQAALSRCVWNLAAPNKLAVLYVSRANSSAEEPHARRQLASLAALTRDDWVKVSTLLAPQPDWLNAVRALLCPGDLVVCHAEQSLPGWRGARPLGHSLCEILLAPVQLLEGFYSGDPSQAAHPTARLLFWVGAVAIVAAAFWLQAQISVLPKNWAESALMALSVVAECGLIGLWSQVFN